MSADQLISQREARRLMGDISQTTLWRYSQKYRIGFPKPVHIKGRTFFRKGEVMEFIDNAVGGSSDDNGGDDNGGGDTSMSQAMASAGLTTPRQRFDQALKEAVSQASSKHQAMTLLLRALEADPRALLCLFDEHEVAQRVQRHIETAWPQAGRGRDQIVSDTQETRVPADKTGGTSAQGDGGHIGIDTQHSRAPTPTQQNGAESAGRAVHHDGDTQFPADRTAPDAGAAGDGGGGHSTRDIHPRGAPSATDRRPGRPKRTGAGTNIGAAMRQCALDRIRINGQALRYAKPDEALQQAERWHIDARTVEAICTGLAPDQPVGEQLSDEEANRLADRASKTTA